MAEVQPPDDGAGNAFPEKFPAITNMPSPGQTGGGISREFFRETAAAAKKLAPGGGPNGRPPPILGFA